MSAGPQPTPESSGVSPGPVGHEDGDGWALLEALRRKLDEQAASGRRTQQQVGQLADSIAALVAEQRRRSRWLNLNSFVAYVLFTVVVGAGFFLLYRSRANELLAARDHATRERDAAVRRADDATGKLTARDGADARAWEIYQLLETGKRADAAGKLAALGDAPLSRTERAVLAARIHETQVMEVDAALKSAAAAFKAGRHADVIAPLEAALVSEPAGNRSAMMRYYLGVAYAKGNELAKALPHLQQAVWSEVDQDDVRFQLASALDRSGQYARARTEYDRFASANPQSPHTAFALRRSATLARMPAVAPASAAATSPAVGAPAASAASTSPPAVGAPSPSSTSPTAGGVPVASPPRPAPAKAIARPVAPKPAAKPAPTPAPPSPEASPPSPPAPAPAEPVP